MKLIAFILKILTPSIAKIVLTLLLFVVSSLLWRTYIISTISDTFPVGFPFAFWETWGPCQPGDNCASGNRLALLGDVAIWYIISAVILTRRQLNK